MILKKGIYFFFKIVLLFLFAVLLLEIILRFFSSGHSGYASFSDFLISAKEKMPQEVSDNVLFFVGDSTVAGEGASVIEQYSLGPLFESLVCETSPEFKVLVFAYPSTSTEDHLQIMRLLPYGAKVIYRGGIIDPVTERWNFRFSLFGKLIEIRALKLFSLLYSRLFRKDVFSSFRSLEIDRITRKIIEEKKLSVFTMDYTSANFLLFSVKGAPIKPPNIHNEYIERIPLINMQKELGLRSSGLLEKRFISTRTDQHPNDLGYYLEAMLLFNYFCQKGFWGLSESDFLSRESLFQRLSNFENKTAERYEKLKNKLKSITPDQLPEKTEEFAKTLSEAHSLSSQLINADKNSKYAVEFRMLDRLLKIVVHDPVVINHFFMHGINKDVSEKELKLLLSIFFSILAPDYPVDESEYLKELLRIARMHADRLKLPEMDNLGGLSPYPLQFCGRFLRNSGFNAGDLSVTEEWGHFFAYPLEGFFPESVVCK